MITSRENALIKKIVKLHMASGRKKSGQYFTEGIRSVDQALEAGAGIAEVVYCAKVFGLPAGRQLMDRVSCAGIKAVEVSESLYNSITDTETPQPVMAVIDMKDYELDGILPVSDFFAVIVDGIRDPGNLGTIIRTAHAAGVHAVVLLKGTVDPYNPKTVRGTMGSIFGIPVIQENDTPEMFARLRKAGVKLIAASPESKIPYWDINFMGKIGIIIGNEANGISEQVKCYSEFSAVLPMPGRAESLNAAVACGILLYKALEQRLT